MDFSAAAAAAAAATDSSNLQFSDLLRKDVFLTIRRKDQTIFTDVKENTKVGEIKKIIEGITKIAVRNLQLYCRENQIMDDTKPISYYGLNAQNSKPQNPAAIYFTSRLESGEFETIEVMPYSTPPDLPYVFKMSECNGADQTI